MQRLGAIRRSWLWLLALTALPPFAVILMPLVERYLIDEVILRGDMAALAPIMAAYAVLWVVVTLAQQASSALRTYLGECASVSLQQRLFAHAQSLSVAFAQREHTGRTLALFTNDVPVVATFVSSTLVLGLSSIVAIIASGVTMLMLSWELALATLFAPPLIGGAAWVATRMLRRHARRVQDAAAGLTEQVQENLRGVREIVAFGQQRTQRRQFLDTLRELLRLRMRIAWVYVGLGLGQGFFALAVNLILFGVGGYLIMIGQTTLGTIFAIRSLFGQVYQPIEMLLRLVGGAQQALASADRITELLDTRPAIANRPGSRAPSDVCGAVSFEHVSFGYSADRPVLRDVSLCAAPGELIALVGPSGAGKSTLASLVARFYDPQQGRVTLDGVDLRDLTVSGLRREISMVFQDTLLFATTVRENVAIGRPDASDADIEAALRDANAWEFVQNPEHGLDTLVGERGNRLSEGQRQRIAIARALLRDAPILILDEPTSAMDARSEAAVQDAIERLTQNRTTFVIAHRLSTVRRADQILVLTDGMIVDRGTHHALLARPGLYRDLYEIQFDGTAVHVTGATA